MNPIDSTTQRLNDSTNKGTTIKRVRILGFIAASAFSLSLFTSAQADSLFADFNIRNGIASVASGGHVTYNLNGNGTIAATLVWNGDAGGTGIFYGFGADASFFDEQSNFSPTLGPSGFITSWGEITNANTYQMGFGGDLSGNCSWTIGSVGEFSSVTQALGGGGPPYDFYVESDDASDPLVFAEWNAVAVITATTVPEPTNPALLCSRGWACSR